MQILRDSNVNKKVAKRIFTTEQKAKRAEYYKAYSLKNKNKISELGKNTILRTEIK